MLRKHIHVRIFLIDILYKIQTPVLILILKTCKLKSHKKRLLLYNENFEGTTSKP